VTIPAADVGVVAEFLCYPAAQPPMPNCWTARLLAVATVPASGASEGCGPEQNRAGSGRRSGRAGGTVIWVAVDILHHLVLGVSRVGLRVAGHGRGRVSR
jgi:hypothetical protein